MHVTTSQILQCTDKCSHMPLAYFSWSSSLLFFTFPWTIFIKASTANSLCGGFCNSTFSVRSFGRRTHCMFLNIEPKPFSRLLFAEGKPYLPGNAKYSKKTIFPAFWFSNGIILHGKLTRHNQHFSKRCIYSRKFCFRSSANIVSVQIYVFPKSKTSFPNLIIVILKQFKLFIVLYCDGWISDNGGQNSWDN